jgi:deazaflavin-dependent oxidoreductase (nitroreductase family)
MSAAHADSTTGGPRHFQRPGWFTSRIFNPIVAVLTRLGLGVAGSRVLEVPGRTSGLQRRTPVNLLELDGERFLVAPRGDTQWSRNLRACGRGRLLLGRRAEPFAAVELGDDEKAPVLRAYLRRWKWEVGVFFDGVSADSSPAELDAIAPRHPVFRIESDA